MIDEQLEFQIAQYADGTLPPAERAALEQTLANDTEARALLDEYRRLDVALKSELPVPAINWDRLAAHLSNTVAVEDRATTTIAWPLRSWGKIAVAAAIALVIGAATMWQLRPAAPVEKVVINNHLVTPPNGSPATNINVVVVVTGPAAQTATAAPIVEINVGPSAWARQTNYGVTDQVVYREPRVMIASGRIDRQDSGRLLPF